MSDVEKLKILIIDDQESDIELVKYYASTLEYDCAFHVANSEKSTIQAIEEFQPDIILSDYQMGPFNGLMALEICSSRLPNTPFILITGYLGEELAVKIIKNGASDFLLKDKLGELPAAIIKALREKEEKKRKMQAEESLKATLLNLEYLVSKRTEELNATSSILEKALQNINDSITYARRIQQAMLFQHRKEDQLVGKSFIFFKPKDALSGDFYWCHVINHKQYIALVDCTGHGVPAAMLSIIGKQILDKVIIEQGISETNKILSAFDEELVKVLNQGTDEVKDGMDVALCSIDMAKKEVQFSGAYLPLYYFNQQKLKEIPGSRFPIGNPDPNLPPKIFDQVSFPFHPGDILYFSSDGYYSQFGGEKGKKMMKTRFKDLLVANAKKPLEEQKEALDKFLVDWSGKEEQVDDILVIGVQF